MKQFVKRMMYAVSPRWTTALMSSRARAQSHRVAASWGCGTINHKLIGQLGNHVQEGPFAGLKLTPMTYAEHLGPYLLGVYESELDAAWAVVFCGSYTQILDIGAKFGYYAVGLAKRYPSASVVAFDTDWWARNAVRELIVANNVGNIEVKGFCSRDWLTRHTQAAAFIISDCEGYEAVLFGPDVIPRLHTATLIIEAHDCFVPGMRDTLRGALGETHLVRVYSDDSGRRQPAHQLDFLSESERRLAVQEVRPPQSWLLCLPKTGPNQALRLEAGHEAFSQHSDSCYRVGT